MSAAEDEYGWVIERGDSEVCAPTYWSGPDRWSQDHMDAIRFSRKQDAERVASRITGWGLHRVAEHAWGPRARGDVFADLLAEIERRKKVLAEAMPDEAACLGVMFAAYQRLEDLGWRDAIYCPKDGTVFDSISAGSAGVHDCHYDGKWPKGFWWVHEAGDLWPARPILWRAKKP